MANRKAVTFVAGLAGLAASVAWAQSGGGTATGQLTNVTVETGIIVFSTTGAHINPPACATSGRFAFNASTAAGQAMEAVALTAYGLGKQISIVGTGACDAWGDSETVSYLVTP